MWQKNPENVSKMKEIKVSAKFAEEKKFHENQGKFELKLSIGDLINSIIGVKNLILDLKTWTYPIPVNQEPSKTNETEIGWNLILKPISWPDQVG